MNEKFVKLWLSFLEGPDGAARLKDKKSFCGVAVDNTVKAWIFYCCWEPASTDQKSIEDQANALLRMGLYQEVMVFPSRNKLYYVVRK
jgi:hypothetical protein